MQPKTPPLVAFPTKNEKIFFSISTTRLVESVGGLNSSLSQSPGELWDCKALHETWFSRDLKGFKSQSLCNMYFYGLGGAKLKGRTGQPTLQLRHCFHGIFSLWCRNSKTFCERPFALQHQQHEKDTKNVDITSPGKISVDAHGPWLLSPFQQVFTYGQVKPS